MGVAINRNNKVIPHKNVKDFCDRWALMYCFGEFEGGELCLLTMSVETLEGVKTGLRMRYGPGDVVLFRATMFEHFVMEFKEKRTCLVYHTKHDC